MMSSLRRIQLTLYLVATVLLGLVSARPLYAQEPGQEPVLDIVEVDATRYPSISVTVRYANLGSSDVQQITLLEDGQMRGQMDTVSLPKKRIGVLLDSYNGLPVDILQKIADAVDQLEFDSWKWQNQELALFVPGVDGKSLALQVGWTAVLWREITNGIVAYHNGAGQNRPTALGTSLKELTYSALQEFVPSDGVENYLIVLTDGYDSGTQITADAITGRKTDNAVQLYFVNYDPDGETVSRVQQLATLAQTTGAQRVDLNDSNGLIPIWRSIAGVDLTSQIDYLTQKKPPFTLIAAVPGTSLMSEEARIAIDIPAVEMTFVSPSRDDVIRAADTQVVLQLGWSGLYPARGLQRATYTVAGGAEQEIDLSRLEANNQLVFTVRGLVDGRNLLDVFVEEEIPGFVTHAQTVLNVDLPPIPTPEPVARVVAVPLAAAPVAAAPVAAATVSATPVVTTPTTATYFSIPPQITAMLAWVRIRVPRQFVNYIPNNISPQNMYLATIGLTALLALVALLLAIAAMRRATNWHTAPVSVIRDRTDTHQKTTDTWSRSAEERKAEMILIQGEGMLPGVVGLHQGKTYFGRDFGQVDELLANRYVSQKQFCVWERSGQFFLGNCSISNPTIVNDREAPRDMPTFPQDGPFLKSGDVIQFGPFKYRFLLSRSAEPTPAVEGANMPIPRRPNPLVNRRTAEQ